MVVKREKRVIKISPTSKSTEIIRQYNLTTKLKHSSGKTAIVIFKNMELTVMENNKPDKKVKYILGDVGVWRYVYTIKRYIAKGYIVEGEISNQNEVLKSMKRGKGEEDLNR